MKTKSLLVLALSLSFTSVYSQTEGQVLDSSPIDVDGYLHEQNVTDGELESIKGTVKKYQNENKLYKEKAKELNKLTNEAEKIGDNAEEKIMANVEAKKAEARAMDKIKKAEAKLKCIMEEIHSPECDSLRGNRDVIVEQPVSVAQAAPAASSVVEAPAAALTGAAFETIKLLPYAGATQFNGKIEQVDSVSGGLRLESNITSRFSMGIGFNLTQFSTADFANNMNYMQDPSYMNNFGLSREIQYRSMGVDLYGKFFLTNGQRFRPYVGAGLGYNRATMKYTQNSTLDTMYSGYNYSYGNEEFKTGYAVGSLSAGSEVMITKGFGLNLELAYSTGLGNAMSSQAAKNPFSGPDQKRLNELGEEIINAHALSLFMGAVIAF